MSTCYCVSVLGILTELLRKQGVQRITGHKLANRNIMGNHLCCIPCDSAYGVGMEARTCLLLHRLCSTKNSGSHPVGLPIFLICGHPSTFPTFIETKIKT